MLSSSLDAKHQSEEARLITTSKLAELQAAQAEANKAHEEDRRKAQEAYDDLERTIRKHAEENEELEAEMAKRKLIIEILTNFAKQNHQALFGFFHAANMKISWEDMLKFLKILEQSDAIYKLLGNPEIYHNFQMLEAGLNQTLDVGKRLENLKLTE